MEAGNAIADVLCGKVNPSAKLTITMASSLDDYLSTNNFGSQDTVYKEDIFVGYRQFETFDPTYSKVNYPFGHGLSYTSFSITPSVTAANGILMSVLRSKIQEALPEKRLHRSIFQRRREMRLM